MGIGPGGLRFRAASRHASSALAFAGGARSLGGANSQADERSEKVRWLWAVPVLNIEVLGGCSVKRLPSVLQALCGPPLELDERSR